jgi:hypothetical protein
MLDEQMNEELMAARALDARIVRALEKSSDAASFIPDDFATRMAGRVPARRTISLRPTYYGRNLMLISMVVLVVVLLALAVGSRDHSALGVVLDWCLCGQLIALAVWLSMRRRGLR